MSCEADKLLPWLSEALDWQAVRFGGALSGGNSNVTWRFDGPQRACVVRTAPATTISPTAHRGIEREHTVLRAIEDQVKVPRVLAWGDRDSPIGRPFLVLECIDGVSITDTLPDAYAGTDDAANSLGLDLMDQLAAVHRVDLEATGLQSLGRPDHFLRRQLRRWMQVRRETAVRELPGLFELGNWLLAEEPPAVAPALIHGDYHLDNTLVSRDEPQILALIDWELATVGDPYTDVALALMLWGDKRCAEPPAFAQLQAISRRPGVLDRRALAERWAEATGRSLVYLDYYLAFAFWRLAAIVEGAYCLYVRGKVDTPYARDLEFNVPALLHEAQQAATGNW